MKKYFIFFILTLISTTFLGCGGGTSVNDTAISNSTETEIINELFNLPQNAQNYSIFPPKIPQDNPITNEKIELGKYLFYDTKLSANQTQSCSSCHLQKSAFSDHNKVGIGSTGEHSLRNPNSLTNTGYYTSYSWANPALTTLERFIILPITGDDPIELGVVDEEQEEVLNRFKLDERYQNLFTKAFPDVENPYTLEYIVKALATFLRTLNSFNSKYDKYIRGDKTALNESEIRGMNLFMGEKAECFHCHDGINFSDSTTNEKSFSNPQFFHNIGLYNINGIGSYPDLNQGLFEITQQNSDKGKFKAPSLRNIELTFPYMHDGSMETLEEIIDLHSNGGRYIESGINAGDGRNNPYLSDFITVKNFTQEEKDDLLAFLKSLTDEEFITNQKIANPFAQDE